MTDKPRSDEQKRLALSAAYAIEGVRGDIKSIAAQIQAGLAPQLEHWSSGHLQQRLHELSHYKVVAAFLNEDGDFYARIDEDLTLLFNEVRRRYSSDPSAKEISPVRF